MDPEVIIELTEAEQTKLWWDVLKIAHDLKSWKRHDLERLSEILSMALTHWHSEASGGGGYWPPPPPHPTTGSPIE